MIKFLRGLRSAVMNKPIKDGQLLYCKDTGEFMIDEKEEGSAGVRRVIRDPQVVSALEGETIFIL